eukprot:5050723-Amphidinium_carterae.1
MAAGSVRPDSDITVAASFLLLLLRCFGGSSSEHSAIFLVATHHRYGLSDAVHKVVPTGTVHGCCEAGSSFSAKSTVMTGNLQIPAALLQL